MTQAHEVPAPANGVDSICQIALRQGETFGKRARGLLHDATLTADDPRLLPDLVNEKAAITTGRQQFLDAVGALQARFLEPNLQENAGRSPPTLQFLRQQEALQKKILAGMQSREDIDGIAAAAIGISMERIGTTLAAEQPGSRHGLRPLFRFAATTTDRVVLSARHRDWGGLAATGAFRTGQSLSESAHDLLRLERIDPADPRLHIPRRDVRRCNALRTPDFVRHLNDQVKPAMAGLHDHAGRVFARKLILDDLEGLRADHRITQADGDASATPAQQHRRHQLFMQGLSHLGERMGLNLDHGPQDSHSQAIVATLLATACSANQRAIVYEARARSAEKDQQGRGPGVAAPRAPDSGRDRDLSA